MKVNEVLKLVDAGFSAAQIAAMAGETKQTEQKETKQTETNPAEPSISDVMAELGSLKAEMKKMALLDTQQTKDSCSVDDILASIINPEQKGDK